MFLPQQESRWEQQTVKTPEVARKEAKKLFLCFLDYILRLILTCLWPMALNQAIVHVLWKVGMYCFLGEFICVGVSFADLSRPVMSVERGGETE